MALNAVMERSKFASQRTAKAYRRTGWIVLILGSLLAAFGLLPIVMNRDCAAALLVLIGAAFALYALEMFRSARQLAAAVKGKGKGA